MANNCADCYCIQPIGQGSLEKFSGLEHTWVVEWNHQLATASFVAVDKRCWWWWCSCCCCCCASMQTWRALLTDSRVLGISPLDCERNHILLVSLAWSARLFLAACRWFLCWNYCMPDWLCGGLRLYIVICRFSVSQTCSPQEDHHRAICCGDPETTCRLESTVRMT